MVEDIKDVLEKYINDYQNDVIIDEFRLKEIELKVPSLKGKWSAIKARNKAELIRMKAELDDYVNTSLPILIQKSNESGNPLSKTKAEYKLKQSKKYKEHKNKIDNLSILVEFFESCEKNIQSMGFDIKNLVETIKLDEGG